MDSGGWAYPIMSLVSAQAWWHARMRRMMRADGVCAYAIPYGKWVGCADADWSLL